MSRRNPATLVALSLIWGASFLFIKIAVRDLAPATLILGRLGFATITLALIAPFAVGSRETLAQLRANAKWLAIAAVVYTAIPFWLLSWGETRIRRASPRSSRRRCRSSTQCSHSRSFARCA